MGIVHHSRYLPYLEEARVAYLRQIGHPYSELQDARLNAAVLEAFVQYRQPLRFDDEVRRPPGAGIGDEDDVPDGLPAHRRRRAGGHGRHRPRLRHRGRRAPPASPPGSSSMAN